MSHTSTLTLLGQANESETGRSNSHGSPSEKMTKSQLNLPIATTAASADPHDGLRNGLRFRDSAALQSDDSQVITDENNNVKKSPEEDGSAGVAAASAKDTVRSNRMWGFFKVDQPVKTLNSILIPIYHLLCLYTIVTTTLDTNPLTIMWGESFEKHPYFLPSIVVAVDFLDRDIWWSTFSCQRGLSDHTLPNIRSRSLDRWPRRSATN